ncbi:cycloartenol synthase-like protein [Pirellula staleyi DSM 6068]|uniref:Cycloartenol synthase-like protein n=1 Tax=Pirellula staleyi (strain ATCC 27377 / DSM 6068 / ICPB 4128) TaxID=530564 RepID=D2R7D4_PIRSD|nr:prenyltransferase/squalene oxidase repeat-containing protein [Pirellula staleyi]ADB15630.1 cycloartenol synthase-like protein [Pirellula staleyi DSM 6068]
MKSICRTLASFVALASIACASLATAADDAAVYQQTVSKAVTYLTTKAQAADGSYNSAAGPAVTALVTASLLKHGRTVDDPAVAKALKYLQQFVQEDGGIYAPESNHKNYETCLGVVCFAAANKDGRFDTIVKKADAFVKGLQWDDKEGKTAADPEFGGAGYGKNKRPDLSNTSFLLDALKATGTDPNSEEMKRALIFVSRCQNLESEHNTTPYAAKNPDGGFYYSPAAGGVSQAGTTETGALRSYASMTYAGLKSMIYAGVGPDDVRVKAAIGWLKKNYDLDSNPGMGTSGLFYYYQTFAKALEATGNDTFVDEKGVEHNWRSELIAELASRQAEDGSFVNADPRWMEGDASLVTGYALLALAHSKPATK